MVLLAEVKEVDLANRRIVLDRGEIGYDGLVRAAGARHSCFSHDGWGGRGPRGLAPGLKSLEDAPEVLRTCC